MVVYRYLIKVNDVVLEVDKEAYKSYTGQRSVFSRISGIRTLQVYRYPDCPFESYTIFTIDRYDQLLPVVRMRCSTNWPLAREFYKYIKEH